MPHTLEPAESRTETAAAKARFDAHRAALARGQWDEALAALREAAALDPGQFAPFPPERYEPQRILGAGGAGTAILCRERPSGEAVVVKPLNAAALAQGIDGVFRDARALRQISHPGLLGVRACGYAVPQQRLRPYLAFEYFPGGTLEQFVRQRGVLSARQLLALALEAARALQAAHGGGVLHGDLRPANVLVRKEGEQWRVKVIDFGLGLRRDAVGPEAAAYAAPEQAGRLPGARPGAPSDVFAFGKLCCYALFGTAQPGGGQWVTIPEELAELLERCTEEQPGQRPPGFGPVVAALEALIEKAAPDAARTKRPEVPPAPAPAAPSPARAALERAASHLKRKDPDAAIADATEAIRLDPRCAPAYGARAAAHRMKGEPERAIADATEAIGIDPRYAFGHFNRAEAHRMKGAFDQAIADGTEAIRLAPNSAPAYGSRAEAHLGKGEWDRAFADATEAIRLAPRAATSYGTRAEAQRMKGAHDGAIVDATHAIRLNPGYAFAHFCRAASRLAKGDYDGAIADTTAALRLAPGAAPAFGVRASAHLGKDNPDAALADANEALRLLPRSVPALRTRAEAHRVKGDYDRAIADATAALRLAPGYALAYGTRGSAFRLKGDFISSIVDLMEAVRLDPNFTWGKRQLELAQQGQK